MTPSNPADDLPLAEPEVSTIAHLRPAKSDDQCDETVFVVGRPPMQEFVSFVRDATTGTDQPAVAELAARWRQAHDRIRELETEEAGAADGAEILNVAPDLAELVQRVLEDPVVGQSFGLVPTRVAVVPLDRLLIYQKFVNLEHVRRLRERLGDAPTADAILRTCLPFDHPDPLVGVMAQPNGAVLTSPSKDFRPLGPVLLRPDQVTGYAPPGPLAGIVGFAVGYGSNYLNVIRSNSRLLLNNGTHRAYALREIGVTHVPCLLQEVTCPEELDAIAPQVTGDAELYFSSPRPPMLRDLFNPALRTVVRVPRSQRQVKVGFGVEAFDIPA